MKDEPIGTRDNSLPRPTQDVVNATMALAKLVESQMGVSNGTTALFWALDHVIQQHAGKRDEKAK